jgi:hypothetical protein
MPIRTCPVPVFNFCFALLSCSGAVQKTDSGIPAAGGVSTECEVLSEVPLDSTDILTRCPLGTSDSSFFFEDQQSWDGWMDSCYGEVDAPDIDFGTHDVVGASVELSCPFSGAPVLLGTQACGGELLTSVWTWPDHCYCDYFDPYLVLYAVEKGLHSSVSIELLFESTCEETICACDDGSTVDACSLTQFCPITDSYTVEVDGLPPEWP